MSTLAARHGRHGIGRAQDAVDGPGLAPDLGHEPSRQHRHEAERPDPGKEAQVPARGEKPAHQKEHAADQPRGDHDHADADHDPEGEEGDDRVRALVRREGFQPAHLAVPFMRQDQAAERRDGELETVLLLFGIGPAEQDERRAFLRLPMRLDGRDLGRLMLARIEPVQVTDHELERREPDENAERHADHDAAMRHAPLPQNVPGADPRHAKCGGEIGGGHHMGEAVGEGRVEDGLPPARHVQHARLVGAEARRRLHEAVGRENPEGGDRRAERHHGRGEKMHVFRHAVRGRTA